MSIPLKHPVEDLTSWKTHVKRNGAKEDGERRTLDVPSARRLRHHHHHKHHHHRHHHVHDDDDYEDIDFNSTEEDQFFKLNSTEEQYLENEDDHNTAYYKKAKFVKKHKKNLLDLWADPGIGDSTVHGMMIDAGSTGSRLHLYEWEPRVLKTDADVQAAVSGRKLTYPGTESRWTDRLKPGLASFATLPDNELVPALSEYLSPLIEFAKAILHQKESLYGRFPIYLRATAGMRILIPDDRARVLDAVRTLFSNKTFCPFYFEDKHARVLSGEEEAIFDWTAVNFLLGSLLKQSEGLGAVVNPELTYGALDLGGASTQISFIQKDDDIMANLFKLQIGQGKHWNVYAHSFLYFGVVEATNRFYASLASDKSPAERLADGIHNPCFPRGVSMEVSTEVYTDTSKQETWDTSGKGEYQLLLKNNGKEGDFEACMAMTEELLHKDENGWCDFAHRGDCSFNGVYQPALPDTEFLAFSNFYDVWSFLNLPERSSVADLLNATRYACSLTEDELVDFVDDRTDKADITEYCFRSMYAFQLLHNGYGFQMDDYITATNVINGHKVGWALGSMLYEINTMPWEYVHETPVTIPPGMSSKYHKESIFMLSVVIGLLLSFFALLVARRRRNQRNMYETLKDVENIG
jgi:Golgi nucleoside diphosphatase